MDQTASPNVLVVDDDPVQRRLLKAAVEHMGGNAFMAEDGDIALEFLTTTRDPIAIVVLDLKMPRMDGLEVMRRMTQSGIEVPVIVQTGHGGIETVVEAMRAGAFDFVVKPVAPERLAVSIRNALKVDQSEERHAGFRMDPGTGMVSASPAMERVMHLAQRAAASLIPVVIEGESGVGKEKIARTIQRASDRRYKPFVTVNCGAIPDKLVESVLFGHERGAFTGATEKHRGKFMEANGGTLFLDEIGDLSPDIQVKLLRAVQDGEIETVGARQSAKVDVRLISATNKNLIEEVKAGRFREDLYYRLNVFPITVPPLRNRKEDVPMLVRSFADRFGREHGLRGPVSISPEVLAMLTAYDWPGNVRQLENAVFRAVVLCDDGLLTPDLFPQIAAQLPGYDVREAGAGQRVAVSDAPSLSMPDVPLQRGFAESQQRIASGLSLADLGGTAKTGSVARGTINSIGDDGELRTLNEVEEEVIRFALQFYSGQMSEVARRLGIGRSTLYRKIKDYGIDAGRAIEVEA
ncbi:sigma-54 dependent transcriptional regulator [Rhizobium sp. EC-SD404]|uniref:sigma-54-dependent transcriptional regulator n=1 Tax=Rhizobium sp. EC-SD404 TaxID=2038389 RepID=UPI001251AF6F|nr:sigma-54 dependent transcriptional regulator [Rhizobium sp. EC-SD404]VVT06153.1 DNA-binding transcriptional response regulator, NtrC family, contains REC, AAA-type ATPase, and a Fis-type DNA-binding domains [Rhizobium sp. EC-SD404]